MKISESMEIYSNENTKISESTEIDTNENVKISESTLLYIYLTTVHVI
jgi:hypothetical protein